MSTISTEINAINTTTTNCCDICTEDRPKAYFEHCIKCLGSICHICAKKLDKCPMCRTTPYKTISLIKPSIEETKSSITEDSEICKLTNNINLNWLRTSYDCNCRIQCKHSRCNCIIHNEKFENKKIIEFTVLFKKLRYALGDLNYDDRQKYKKIHRADSPRNIMRILNFFRYQKLNCKSNEIANKKLKLCVSCIIYLLIS